MDSIETGWHISKMSDSTYQLMKLCRESFGVGGVNLHKDESTLLSKAMLTSWVCVSPWNALSYKRL